MFLNAEQHASLGTRSSAWNQSDGLRSRRPWVQIPPGPPENDLNSHSCYSIPAHHAYHHEPPCIPALHNGTGMHVVVACGRL